MSLNRKVNFVQLGPKLNTKIGLNHPPPGTFRPLPGKVEV